MGSGFRSSDDKGVWSSDQSFFHTNFLKLESLFPRSEEIPEVNVCHKCPDSGRQHHGDALSEQGGRDQVQVLGLEGPGDFSLLSEHEDYIVVHILGQDNVEADRLSRF